MCVKSLTFKSYAAISLSLCVYIYVYYTACVCVCPKEGKEERKEGDADCWRQRE